MPICLSGLDMPWLNDPAKRLTPRAKKERIDWSAKRSDTVASPFFMADLTPFVSPVGEGNEVISSRPQLREHEKKHNVVQCGDFKPGEIAAKNDAKKAARAELAKGVETGWGEA